MLIVIQVSLLNFSSLKGGVTDGQDWRYLIVSTVGPYNVYCDVRNDIGWTILMQREKMDVDFMRTWEEYKEGFGDLRGTSFSSISELKGD